jgi:hypothetical protein
MRSSLSVNLQEAMHRAVVEYLAADVDPVRQGTELHTKGIKGLRFPANAAPFY